MNVAAEALSRSQIRMIVKEFRKWLAVIRLHIFQLCNL